MDNTGEQDPGATGHPGVSHRPPPPRPEFHVEPRRPSTGDATPRPLRAAVGCWIASLAVLIGIAAATALDLADVRDALESSLAGESPDTSSADIADAVSLTLLGCAAAGAVLFVAALIGLQVLRARRAAGRIVLAVVGAASVAAAFVFWSLLADATDATGGVLQWAPTVYVLLVIAGVALLFTPAVTDWLRGRR
ncbi:hypothetical protein ACWDUM_25795 [Rhodococcus sp. NPDC003322]